MEKPTFEQIEKAEKQALDAKIYFMQEAQKEALQDKLDAAPKYLEQADRQTMIEAHSKNVEQKVQDLVQQHEERMDRWEIEYKGPPSERER